MIQEECFRGRIITSLLQKCERDGERERERETERERDLYPTPSPSSSRLSLSGKIASCIIDYLCKTLKENLKVLYKLCLVAE